MSARVTLHRRRVLWQIRHDRARSRSCCSCPPACSSSCATSSTAGRRSSSRRRAAVRALPVHRDVPDHLDRDAARAHDRHARAADDPAAGEARPARRLRARVRPARRGAGGGRLHRRASPGSASTRRTAPGSSACSRSATPCSAWRSGCSSAPSPAREFQAVQFMPALDPPPVAAVRALHRARRDGAGAATRSPGPCRSPTPTTRSPARRARSPLGAGLAVDVAVIGVSTLGALGLGALTLRRRTA